MKSKIDQTAEILKALGHPTRLTIVMGLIKNNGECNVSMMVEKLGMSQPNISQHLTILKNAGIIEGYKNGTNICYKVEHPRVLEIAKCLEGDCGCKKNKLF